MAKIDINRLCEYVQDPKGLSVTQICQNLGCSRDTYYRKRKMAQNHGWAAAFPLRKKKENYFIDSSLQKQIFDTAISNPDLGYRRLKKLLPETVSIDVIKNTLRKYDIATTADRLVARYVLSGGEASLISQGKGHRKRKVDRIITPELLTQKDLAKILGNVVPSARSRIPIIFPNCIILLSFRHLDDLIPGKNALEVRWRDIFSNYMKVRLYELKQEALEKQYDQILAQTIIQDIFSKKNICRLLFIEDYSDLFPYAMTQYKINHNLIYKFKYPKLKMCLSLINKNAFALVRPQDPPISDNIIAATRQSSGKSISEIDKKIQASVSRLNNSNNYGKFCFGRTPKQTFDQGKKFRVKTNMLLLDKDFHMLQTIFARFNESRQHSYDCDCPNCWFVRSFLPGSTKKFPHKKMAKWREVAFEKQTKYTLY